MRQVGVLAATGLVALDENVNRLAEDHAHARALAGGLAAISGVAVDPESVQSNIVVFDVAGLAMEPEEFVSHLASMGVRIASVGGSKMRAVTSYEVSSADIDYALQTIAQLSQNAVAVPT
jgi:threonine aldolase